MEFKYDIDKPACSCSHCQPIAMQQQQEETADAQTSNKENFKAYIPATISFFILILGIIFDFFFNNSFFTGFIRLFWYLAAFLVVGYPVLKEAFETIIQKDFFNEFTLMCVATIGAFCIGQYPEGVAVMLFYYIGELFQDAAVNKAQRNIKALLDIRPEKAFVKRANRYVSLPPKDVKVGETIQVKAGEKVPLDGKLISEGSTFDTKALTGESKPSLIRWGESVLAGMINLEKVIEIEVGKEYADSSLARILDMVQNATNRKAKTELLITRFARIYTPLVFVLALSITLIPALFVSHYVFSEWLYRGLVFLVISCPCALVVSIPLGYFGGIGAASRHGILFKGANFIDTLCRVNTVVFDKTGTLTKGVFKIQQVNSEGISEAELLKYARALEQYSNHPIAKAILQSNDSPHSSCLVTDVKENAGFGIQGVVDGKNVVVGNGKFLQQSQVDYDKAVDEIPETTILVGVNAKYVGYILIADEVKEDAAIAIEDLNKNGIFHTVILSGDKQGIVQSVAAKLGIEKAFGGLLPENKVAEMDKLMEDKTKVVAFVGDGINDTPVLALSDVGIAMGGMGTDAAIESADVVIQTDHPSKVAIAIQISQATKNIVTQNIVLAFGIKLAVLLLGGFGLANMWEAVFADVGVALLAILNATRILRKNFD